MPSTGKGGAVFYVMLISALTGAAIYTQLYAESQMNLVADIRLARLRRKTEELAGAAEEIARAMERRQTETADPIKRPLDGQQDPPA